MPEKAWGILDVICRPGCPGWPNLSWGISAFKAELWANTNTLGIVHTLFDQVDRNNNLFPLHANLSSFLQMKIDSFSDKTSKDIKFTDAFET